MKVSTSRMQGCANTWARRTQQQGSKHMTTQHAQKKGWISIALIFALGGPHRLRRDSRCS